VPRQAFPGIAMPLTIPSPTRAAVPWIVSSGTFFAAFVLLSLLAPPHLAWLLDGPDGTRWAGPFILWMGSCGALFLALVPKIRRHGTGLPDLFSMAALFFFAALILFVACQRLSSGLRVNEGYNAAMSVWLSMGGSLYPDPELAPLGSIYGPLYFLLCAPLHLLFPGVPGIGRLISLAATAATAGILYLGGKRKAGTRWAGVWAAALFCATYSPMRQLYDMVNMDPLTMALCAVALYFFLARTDRGDLLALFFAACACFAKQTALPLFLVVLGGAIIARRKPWVYAPVLVTAIAGALLLAVTHGRAWEYMALYPLHHHWSAAPDKGDCIRLFIVQLPLWAGFIIAMAMRPDRRLLAAAAVLMLSALAGMWKGGGGLNAAYPLETALCLGAVYALDHNVKRLLAIQLLLGLFNPFAALYPWFQFKAADREEIALVKTIDGEVWLPSEGYLAPLAGKAMWDQYGAVESRCWAGYEPPRRLLSAITTRRFARIILRKDAGDFLLPLHPAIRAGIEQQYRKSETHALIVYSPAPDTTP